MKNKRILFYFDNDSVVHVINKQTFKDMCLLVLVRLLVVICVSQNVYFRARHVAGKDNILADSLSFAGRKFQTLVRGMDLSRQ